MSFLGLLVFVVGPALIFGQESAPVVTIPDGKIRGATNRTVGLEITYYAYRGIPYAKKPTGDLRFANPVKNDPWSGILNATKDKDVCTQTPLTVAKGSSVDLIVGSEDCLYINVYTTNITGSLPVMVWIHGGAFITGSSSYSQFAPDYILEKDIVYVAFNYRLGVFGFLSTEDSVAPGNWGLKDQVLALKWVKNNIRHFGGNPNKITIFGESAGSASVSYMVQSNLTTGLFNGAIMQSGFSLCQWALARNARDKAFNVGLKLGFTTYTSQDLITSLRKVDYKTLKVAESNVTSDAFIIYSALAGLPFGVVEEPASPEAVFSSKSHELLKKGAFQKVPMIIGFNSNEGAALQDYFIAVKPALLLYDRDPTTLTPHDLTKDYLKRLYSGSLIKTHYFGDAPLAGQPEALTKLFTTDQFNRAIREAVNLISSFVKVFYYELSYEGLLGSSKSSAKGVAHAKDLNYIFANRGAGNPKDRVLRQKVVTLWTNFAKTGNPIVSDGTTLLQGVNWVPNTPSDDTKTTIKYLNINATLTMQNNPQQEEWEFYEKLYNKFGSPPYGTY